MFIREEFEVLEVLDQESQQPLEGQDLIDVLARLEERFKEDVALVKSDLESLISKK